MCLIYKTDYRKFVFFYFWFLTQTIKRNMLQNIAPSTSDKSSVMTEMKTITNILVLSNIH